MLRFHCCRLALYAIAVALALPRPVSAESAWPQGGHDAGQRRASALLGPHSAPSVAVTSSTVPCTSAFLVAGVRGEVFAQVSSSSQLVNSFALSRRGSQLWPAVSAGSLTSAATGAASPALTADASLVFVNHGSTLEARAVADGEVVWRRSAATSQVLRNNGSFAAPVVVGPWAVAVVSDDTVLGGYSSGTTSSAPTIRLYAFSARTGAQLWSLQASDLALQVSAPSAGWGYSFFFFTRRFPVGVNASLVFEPLDDASEYQSPEGRGRRVKAADRRRLEAGDSVYATLLAVNMTSGETAWSVDFLDSPFVCLVGLTTFCESGPSAPVVSQLQPLLFVTFPNGVVSGLDARTGESAWAFPFSGLPPSPFAPALVGSALIVPWDASLYAIDVSNGNVISAYSFPGDVEIASELAVDGNGTLYVALVNNGLTTASLVALSLNPTLQLSVNLTTEPPPVVLQQLWTFSPPSGRVVGNPVIGDCGLLYVALSTGSILALSSDAAAAGPCGFGGTDEALPPLPPSLAADSSNATPMVVGGVVGALLASAAVVGAAMLVYSKRARGAIDEEDPVCEAPQGGAPSPRRGVAPPPGRGRTAAAPVVGGGRVSAPLSDGHSTFSGASSVASSAHPDDLVKFEGVVGGPDPPRLSRPPPLRTHVNAAHRPQVGDPPAAAAAGEEPLVKFEAPPQWHGINPLLQQWRALRGRGVPAAGTSPSAATPSGDDGPLQLVRASGTGAPPLDDAADPVPAWT